MKAMIIISNGVEECEALITYDLLERSSIEVDLVGLKEEVLSSHNVSIKAQRTIKEVLPQTYDCLVLPGGMPGTLNLKNDPDVSRIIDEFVKQGKLVAAICAAPSILLEKRLLKDKQFTCFPGFECGLLSTGEKVTKYGNFITARGLGAAFEFAQAIIETLTCKQEAQNVLKKIQY